MNANQNHCLAIDLGTFSSRAMVFDARGKAIETSQQAIALERIDASHVEQDASEILHSIQHVIDAVLSRCRENNIHISQAGLTTQRSSIVAWQPSSGQAISPVLSWQDTRAGDWLTDFSRDTSLIQQSTGLRLSAHYGVSKIKWLLLHDNSVQQAIAQHDCVITPLASFVLFHISDSPNINIDIANASRTLLCNLYQRDWDAKLIELFGLATEILPACRPILFDYGCMLNSETHITAVNGDQTSALYSDGVPAEQALRVNLGTGAFALCPAGTQQIKSAAFVDSGLLAGISSSDVDSASYYIEGTVNGAGAAIRWLEKDLGIDNILDHLPAAPLQHSDVIFINAVGNMGSPIWRDDIHPHFIDAQLQPAAPAPEQALRAVLESIVFLLQLNIDRMTKLNLGLKRIDISGGLSKLDIINQMLANLSALPVYQSTDTEATARGIAWLAMHDRSNWQPSRIVNTFHPQADERLRHHYHLFTDYLLNNQ